MNIVAWTLSHEIDLCLCLLLQTQEMTGNLAVNKGEYWCPLCRQLANSVIPIPPEEDQFTIKRPLSSDPKQLIKDVADMMVSRPITPVCTTLRDYSFLIISSLWVEDSSEFFWVCCVHVSVCCLKAFYIFNFLRTQWSISTKLFTKYLFEGFWCLCKGTWSWFVQIKKVPYNNVTITVHWKVLYDFMFPNKTVLLRSAQTTFTT